MAWIFMLVGGAAGLLVPFFATLAMMHAMELPFNAETFLETHASEPILWLLDVSPFVSAFMAWLAAANRAQAEKLSAITTDMIESWHRMNDHARVIREVTAKQAEGGAVDFRTFLGVVLSRAAESLKADMAGIFLLETELNDERPLLSCPVFIRDGEATSPEGLIIEASEMEVSFSCLKNGEPRRIADTTYMEDARPAPYKSLGVTDTPASFYVLPIRSEGRTIGVVNFACLHEPRQWQTDEENFADAVANYIALLLVELEKRKARAADKAKSEFLAVMSHELRTPLNAINGFTELIQMEGDIQKVQEYAGHVKEATDMLMVLISELLDLSRLERGQIDLEISQFNIHKLLGECRTVIENQIGDKPVKATLTISEDVPEEVVADKTRLRQIILNLLNNAVKFTSEGEVGLTCAVLDDSGDGAIDTLRFEVRDTGIGIPQDKQHEIFEMFTQVDSDLSRDYGGTGIGLAVCKRLVNLMNGVIDVNSTPGEGSTFWFTIRPEAMYEDAANDSDAGDNQADAANTG